MGHAIFEQRSGIIGVAVASPCGIITAEQLLGLGALAKQLNVLGMKLTTRQTLVILINKGDLEQFKHELQKTGLQIGVFGNAVRNVKGCAGNDQFCRRGKGDAWGLGVKIQEKFMNQPTPKDFKISTAGCVRGCTDPFCADFGVIAVGPEQFDLYLGGRGGSKVPRHGQRILEGVTSEQVFAVLEYVLNRYRLLGLQDERLCRVIERCGINDFIPPAKVYKKECAAQAAQSDDFSVFLENKQRQAKE